MSNQQLAAEHEVATPSPTREPPPQRSAAVDHSEDHLIRGYN